MQAPADRPSRSSERSTSKSRGPEDGPRVMAGRVTAFAWLASARGVGPRGVFPRVQVARVTVRGQRPVRGADLSCPVVQSSIRWRRRSNRSARAYAASTLCWMTCTSAATMTSRG